jgi:hypothetical protein
MKKGILFKKPIFKDWIVLVWIAFTMLNWLLALERVFSSGGPFFTFFSIISGLTDAAIHLLIAFVFPVLPLLLVRKIFWIMNKKK